MEEEKVRRASSLVVLNKARKIVNSLCLNCRQKLMTSVLTSVKHSEQSQKLDAGVDAFKAISQEFCESCKQKYQRLSR